MPVRERQGRRAGAAEGRSWPDEALLVVRASEGDTDAFETLVRRYTPGLLRLATRLLADRGDAEDAVQDAFVSAWRRLPQFRNESQFRTWMFRIVTNKCLNQLRARHPTTPLDAVPEPTAPDHAVSPARAAENAAAVSDLGGALRRLPPEQHACWVLRTVYGLSYDDIAAAVGINSEAVRGKIYRARRALTEAMVAWR
ncbi:RNA polymerase sigma factor [Streptomyces fuscigenes]|uniref:RNA polymerase sigma factor n=1 Tax=Streptomyces fuscigenes TaxID=1528880 RepID=UPI001F299217|nr:RNA polymerase sigma factor [Streptomyces fuscigenes]MCF3960547.1 RNA polymerase sigma factor [Streptomyces fuscigenes]